MADRKHFPAKGLIGGAATDLDYISVSGIADDDIAFVTESDIFYIYQYDSSSAAAEDSPNVITPDDAGVTGRWILQKKVTLSVVDTTLSGTPKIFTDYDSAGTPYYHKSYPIKV